MNKISAIIVVADDAPRLKQSLDSIEDFVSEIILVDIGMDQTLEKSLSNYKNLTVVKIDKKVPYIELIREDLKKHAKNDFILFIDPDEELTSELKKELTANLKKYDYFSIPRKNIIFAKWIQNSRWWPDHQVRLFKKNKVTWPKEIHRPPQVEENGLMMEAREELAIIHYNYDDIDHYFSKMLRYAKIEAKEYVQSKKELTLAETIRKALSEFIARYFQSEGYKDGFHGFALAFLQLFNYFVVHFYYWEMKKYAEPQESPVEAAKSFFDQGSYETDHWVLEKGVWPKSKLRLKVKKFFNRLFTDTN